MWIKFLLSRRRRFTWRRIVASLLKQRALGRFLALSLLCSFIGAAVRAQNGPDNDPDGAPGYVNSYFHHSSVDSINLYNGMLTIPIAIGPAYPVGPRLKFQATLVYSARITDYGHPAIQSSDFSYVVLSGDPALGAGWTFNVGSVKDCRQGVAIGVCYVGPDGASHFFQVGVGQFGKAEDASQLILHDQGTVTAGPYEMWDGDGNHYILDHQVSGLDDVPMDTANNGYAHDFGKGRDGWYLTSVSDPFGNTYGVQYRPSADLPCWSYFDTNCAGAQTSTHMRCLSSTASWVPQFIDLPTGTVTVGPGTNPDVTGSLIGSFNFPVKVGGVSTNATWSLDYQTEPYPIRCGTIPPSTPINTTAHLVKLAAIRLPSDLPGAPSYTFQYSGSEAGLLSNMTLPTSGFVDYTYADYSFYHGRIGALEPGCQGPPTETVRATFEITSSNSVCSVSSPTPKPPTPAIPGGCSSDNTARWLDTQTGVVSRRETVPGGPDGTVVGVTDYVQFAFPFGERGTYSQPQPSQTLTVVVTPEADKNGAATGRRTAKGILFWGSPKNSFSGQVQPGDRTGADIEERIFDIAPNCFIPTAEIPMPACGGASPQAFCSDKAVRVTQRGYDYDDTNTEAGNRRLKQETTYHQALQTDGTCPFGCRSHSVNFTLDSSCDPGGVTQCTWESNGRHYNVETHSGTLGSGNSDQHTIATAWNTSGWGVVPPGNGFALPNLMRRQVESDSGPLVVKRYFFFENVKGFLNGTANWDQNGATALLTCRYPKAVNDGTPQYEVYALQSQTSEPTSNPCQASIGGWAGLGTDGKTFGKTFTFQQGLLTSSAWMVSSGSAASWFAKRFDRDTASGWVTKSYDTAGLATSYLYDSVGRPTCIKPPGAESSSGCMNVAGAEAVTSVAYPSTTQTVAARDGGPGLQTSQEYDYDGLGRLIRESKRMPGSQSAKRFYLFDGAGHQYFQSDWVDAGTSEALSSFSLNPGPTPTCAFASGGYTTNRPWTAPGSYSLCFDTFGRPQQIVGSSFSSLVKVDRTDGPIRYSDTLESAATFCINGSLNTNESCGTGGSNATTANVNDPFGRLTSVTEPDNAVTGYTYDVNNKLTRVSQVNLPARTFTYDPLGFLRSEFTPEKGSVSYDYGGLGNVLSETFPGSPTLIVSRSYDFAGRVAAVTSNEGGSRTYLSNSYNNTVFDASLGKLTSRTATNYSVAPNPTASDFYTYGGLGGRLSNVQTQIVGSQSLTTFQNWQYNALGLIAQHSHARQTGAAPFILSLDYDAALPITEYINGIPMVKNITYWSSGAFATYTTGIGIGHDVTTTIGQDGLIPRPSSISTTGATSNFQTGTYGYDGAGNVKAMGPDGFGYDSRSRLTSAALSGSGSQTFTYDQAGNLLTKNGTPGNATFCSTFCANNQISGATYARGNLTNYAGQTFSWDGLDRMASSSQSGLTFSYLYDGSDERVAKIPPTGDWTFTLRDESKRVVSEYSGAATSRDNVFLGSQLVTSYANLAVGGNDQAWSFYSSDHLGTPRLATNVTGAGVARQYWPFGEAVALQGSAQALRFAAMEFDAEGGTGTLAADRYYDHARSHVGGLGRFLTTDILQGEILEPQSWNRYSYARGNPLRYVDPNGREIRVAVHNVFPGNYHSSIMIIPENQGLFAGRGPFTNSLPDGRKYATLGAGPSGLRLKSDPNRPNDVNLANKVEYETVDVGSRCEDDVVVDLLAADSAYKDDLLYDPVPLPFGPGHNSNSYVSGLLGSVGLPVPAVKKSVRGYGKPISAAKFSDKRLATEEERLRALGLKRGKNGIEPVDN